MSKPKEQVKLTVELMRRGAIMMKEPCSVCNGVQIKYHDRVYCTNHDDLSSILSATEVTYADVTAGMRELLLNKLKEGTKTLEKEEDLAKADQIASLMLKYVELLNRISEGGGG